MEPEYRWQTAAEQAIIDSQNELRAEIHSLRKDLANAQYVVSDQVAAAILEVLARLAQA